MTGAVMTMTRTQERTRDATRETTEESATSDTAEEPSGGIFINYRQCDARGRRRRHAIFVESLSHLLAQHFGGQKVFIDRSTSAGSKYPERLKQQLATCEVLLVVIHTEWFKDLHDRDKTWKDWVHYEITTVLERRRKTKRGQKAMIIPIILDDAQLPDREKLPEDIRELLLFQTIRLRSGSLPDDLTRLVAELETHVRPSWPVPEADDIKPDRQSRPTSVGAVAGAALGAVSLATTLGVVFTGDAPEWVFAASAYSLVFMAAPLLARGIVTIFLRQIYKIERELFSEPSGRYLLFALIVGLGTLLVVMVMLGQPASDRISQTRAVVLVGIFIAGLFISGVAAVRLDRADRAWPPKILARPGPLRRAVVRLHERLTLLWRPPLSRLQRDQAWTVFDQLAKAIETLTNDVARSRRNWLLTDHPRKALSYSVWVAGTIGLAAGPLLALTMRGDANLRVVLVTVLLALIAGALSLGTMEVTFRSRRMLKNWLIADVRRDLNERLLPHMPARTNSTVVQHLTGIPDLAGTEFSLPNHGGDQRRNGDGEG